MIPAVSQAVTADYTFSPDPDVEAALQRIHALYPPLYPADPARPRDFYRALGNPNLHLPPVFHVAGTNGKGSTLAFLQAIFEQAGLRVHKYTSPHLVRFEERIVIGGRMIGAAALLDLIAECESRIAPGGVSFFEFITGMAYLAFSRHPADAVLLETGLGGTHDATNVCDTVEAAILTRISYDHQHILGNSLREIAANKAGIMRCGCPAILAPQAESAVTDYFRETAVALGATIVDGWTASATADGFLYQSPAHVFRLPPPALLGAHQVINAATAIAAVESSRFSSILTQDNLARAMRGVVWPGRMQRLQKGPGVEALPAGWQLWLDGSHNDSGAETIVAQVADWRREGGNLPLHIITAYKSRKDIAGFYAPLAGLCDSIQCLDLDIGAPMVPAAELCTQLSALGFPAALPAAGLEAAIARILTPARLESAPAGRIMVTGSLYLAGHVLKTHG